MSATGERLDARLVREGRFESRAKAHAAVMAGLVTVEGRRATKAGRLVRPEQRVEVEADPCPYVGRGGLKIRAALDGFGIDVSGRVVLDVGASTGGFTDCLLQRGAALVYAVDVGYGQLAWKLRTDPRVVVLEKTNARYLTEPLLVEAFERHRSPARGSEADPGGYERARPNLAAVDVSFVSLLKVLPSVSSVLAEPREILPLVKPQFEAGRSQVRRGGVVRDPLVHAEVLERVVSSAGDLGLAFSGVLTSPITGPSGNIEFWVHLQGGAAAAPQHRWVSRSIGDEVRRAHRDLF